MNFDMATAFQATGRGNQLVRNSGGGWQAGADAIRVTSATAPDRAD
jgi:hypothetical protein